MNTCISLLLYGLSRKTAELSSAYTLAQGLKNFGTLCKAYTVRNRNKAEIMKRRK